MKIEGGRGRHAGPIETTPGVIVVAANDTPQAWKQGADYVCDGVADEVQIQAALDKVAAYGGGQVFLATGAYSISAKLTIDDGVWLCGGGNQTILTLANGVNDSILQNTTRSAGGDSNIRISDMRFDGNKSNNTTSGSDEGVVDMILVSNLVIQGIEIVEADMVALSISECNTVDVSGCYIATADKDGIAVVLESFDVIIANNIIFSCGVVTGDNSAIEIQDGTYNCILSNNVIDSCAYGIEVTSHATGAGGLPCYNITIISNVIKDCIRGIIVYCPDGDNIPYNLNISANTVIDTVDEAPRYCLFIDHMNQSVISGNTFSNYRQAIELRSVLSDIVFTDNVIKGLGSASAAYTAMKFLASGLDVDRFVISNNIFEGYGYEAIFFDGGVVDDVLIAGNIAANYNNGVGRAITIDAGTYSRIVLSNNYFDTTPNTIRDNGGGVYDELPIGWRCMQSEPYNKRTITAASANIEADETGKMFYIDTASNAVTVTLPDAVVGLEFTFFLTDATTAQSLRIEPDTGDTIALATGVQEAVNDYITNATAEAVGDGCRLKCRLAGRWEHFDSVGTWTGE